MNIQPCIWALGICQKIGNVGNLERVEAVLELTNSSGIIINQDPDFHKHSYLIVWSKYAFKTSYSVSTSHTQSDRNPFITPVAGSIFRPLSQTHCHISKKRVQEWTYLQILLCFSSNPSILVGKVFLCGRSWPQLQLRNEGTPPDFESFFLEKRPWKHFSTNVLIRGEMNPLHKHKIVSVGY